MEAHVMNYQEILEAAEKRNVVWEEFRDKEKVYAMQFDGADFTDISGDRYLLLMECDEDCMDYNWNYRLWNNMPTTSQRMTAPWNENPYDLGEEI